MPLVAFVLVTLGDPESRQVEEQRRTVLHARGLSWMLTRHQSSWETTGLSAHSDALTLHREEPAKVLAQPLTAVNTVHLVGRLAADVDIRPAGAGTVARLRVATNDTRVAEFHTVAAWGGLTETAAAMAKGDTVEVTGRLRTRSWTGQDGARIYATEIVANSLRLLRAKTP